MECPIMDDKGSRNYIRIERKAKTRAVTNERKVCKRQDRTNHRNHNKKYPMSINYIHRTSLNLQTNEKYFMMTYKFST